MTDKQFVIRDAVPGDRNFIYETWMKGLRYSGEWLFEEIDHDIFYKKYRDVINKIISVPGTLVKVACLSDDQDVALGYIVYTGDTIHWIFTKDSWRMMGLARMLQPDYKFKYCSHLSKIGRSLKYTHRLIFNPFID